MRACTAEASAALAPAVEPPRDREQMLQQATSAVQRASVDGVRRFIVRLFVPRGEGGDNELAPPDESWQGGIMQARRPHLTCPSLARGTAHVPLSYPASLVLTSSTTPARRS